MLEDRLIRLEIKIQDLEEQMDRIQRFLNNKEILTNRLDPKTLTNMVLEDYKRRKETGIFD